MNRIFHSERYLGRHKKDYFEGWYYRHSSALPFSFIVGVSKNQEDAHSFIQYIDAEDSYYFRYPLHAFQYNKKTETVFLNGCQFSAKGIDVQIKKDGQEINAKLKYSHTVSFEKSICVPSIMGPFSYLPLPCSHAVISLRHTVKGSLFKNGKEILADGEGYIEKDYGSSFPENYFWTHLFTPELSLMFAAAWPLLFKIRGFLCLAFYRGKQYNFSLYTGTKLRIFELSQDRVSLVLTHGESRIDLFEKSNEHERRLCAPGTGGAMTRTIQENLFATANGRLILGGEKIILKDEICAFESVIGTP